MMLKNNGGHYIDKPMFSIIMPVYNVREYIDLSIQSVLNQTYADFELIIVDDGSTDGSRQICESYCLQDERIKLIAKQNGGVSSARNAGLLCARGKYIIFLDSDDMLDIEVLNVVNETLTIDWDLLQLNYEEIDEDGKSIGKYTFRKLSNTKEDIIRNLISRPTNKKIDFGKNFRAIGAKAFKRQIIIDNNLLFPEDLYIGEDAIFLLSYFLRCNNIYFLDEQGYKYRKRSTSAVNRYKSDLLKQSIIEYRYINEYISRETFKNINAIIQGKDDYLMWIYYKLAANEICGTTAKKSLYRDHYLWRNKYIMPSKFRNNALFFLKTYGVKHLLFIITPILYETVVELQIRIKSKSC